MKKQHILVSLVPVLLLTVIAVGLLVNAIRPRLMQSVVWHSKKAAQSVYMHEVKKMGIPLISQTRNLNCEAATAAMILHYYGKESNIDTIQNALPLNENPNLGFRGNVDGNIWGFEEVEPADFGEGKKQYTIITDRYKALQKALSIAKDGDVLVINGKGHEKSIARKDREDPWSDQEKTKEILTKMGVQV